MSKNILKILVIPYLLSHFRNLGRNSDIRLTIELWKHTTELFILIKPSASLPVNRD
jgi:hypothetical protein